MNEKNDLTYYSSVEVTEFGTAMRIDFLLPSLGQLETAVLELPHRSPKMVICTPSQVGCPFGCKFCGLEDYHQAKKSVSNILNK